MALSLCLSLTLACRTSSNGYYIQVARKEMTDFFKLTVYTRSSLIIFFAAFVLLGLASPTLILFGVVDLLGAIWTGLALRSEKTA